MTTTKNTITLHDLHEQICDLQNSFHYESAPDNLEPMDDEITIVDGPNPEPDFNPLANAKIVAKIKALRAAIRELDDEFHEAYDCR